MTGKAKEFAPHLGEVNALLKLPLNLGKSPLQEFGFVPMTEETMKFL